MRHRKTCNNCFITTSLSANLSFDGNVTKLNHYIMMRETQKMKSGYCLKSTTEFLLRLLLKQSHRRIGSPPCIRIYPDPE